MDSGEFDVWVRAAAPRLHRTAFLLTGDWAIAQDLVQHTCASIWPRFTTLHNPEAYARVSMARTASAWWRRRWRAELPRSAVPEPDPGEPWDDIDQAVALRDAVLRLPHRQRAVVVLRFYDDLTEVETARALGWPVGTVKSTTARAIAALRNSGLDDREVHR